MRWKTILIHYTWQLAVIALVYGVDRIRRRRRPAGQQRTQQQQQSNGAATQKKGTRVTCRFIEPAKGQYTPSNPRWLMEAVQHPPSGNLPATGVLPCPLLVAFMEHVQQTGGKDLPSFGHAAREQLFCLEDKVTYLNHGSYGAAFKLAMQVQSWYQWQLEAQPVRFMETVAVAGVQHASAAVARFVGAQAADVVLVTNATTAVNTVLHSLGLQRGDVILLLNTTYPAVRSAAARVAAAAHARLLEVQLSLGDLGQAERIVASVQQAVRHVPRGRLRLAILDHVVSFPPAIMPVAELTHVCKQAGALVLVDGAHAVGALPDLDVTQLGADWYTSNLHKWCCTPKGAAFLWAHPSVQQQMVPPITSHGYGLGFQGEFLWQGTRDITAWLAIPAALHVMAALGGPGRIAAHNHRLVCEAVKLLQQAWPDADLQQVGGDGQGNTAGMLTCSLPPLQGYTTSPEAAAQLHDWLRNTHSIEVPVVALQGRLWVRLSAQIYNTIEDYQRLLAELEPLVSTA